MRIKFLLFFCLLAVPVFAQTPQQIEVDLLKKYDKILYWSNRQFDTNKKFDYEDSLINSNRIFQLSLQKYTEKYPATMEDSFSPKYLTIASAKDKLLKIYSWNTNENGTWRNYVSVIQYCYKQQIKSVDPTDWLQEGTSGDYYPQVFIFNANGNTYYLVQWLDPISSTITDGGVIVWAINNGFLDENIKLFKTASGIKNSINYEFAFNDNISGLIKFDEKNKMIYIPLITAQNQLTHKYITYKFNGQYFVRVKN